VSITDAKILAESRNGPFCDGRKKGMGFEYHEEVVLSKAKAK
jgi:CDGSH-type Zn-finger protein